jgi:acetamidase/formamidase
MAAHVVELERRTLHGTFSRDFDPILTIQSGDTVRFRTLDAGWNAVPNIAPGVPGGKFEPRIQGRDDGHALCGPVAVRGAEPGMALEVHVKHLRPGTWAWTEAGGWPSTLNVRLGMEKEPQAALLWSLDAEAMVGRDQFGREVPLHPFMGVMGMPPDEPGLHSTSPPRAWGGNIDCKELVAGSSLYLPIPVPGALFSVGDGHAAQGDGEVCGNAMECHMERVELVLTLHPDLHISTPRANTPAGWITFGFHQDLDEAVIIALEAMLDLMREQHKLQAGELGRREALALASILVDMRITQLVNGVRGVHAVLPHGALA